MQCFDHHPIGSIVLCTLVIGNECHWDNKEQKKEEAAEDDKVIVLLQQEARQTNANLGCLGTIWVAVFLVVPPGNIVSKCLVCLGDLDEP